MAADEFDDKPMPLIDHLVELRNRLLVAVATILLLFVVCFQFAGAIYDVLLRPLALVHPDLARGMIFTSLTEPFFVQVQVAFFAACFIGFPIIATQFWLFVAPGLYRNEKRALLPFLAATPVLFVAGAAFVYVAVLPAAFAFFLSFETAGGDGTLAIQYLGKVSEYLSLVMTLIFAFGVAFQLPVALTLLVRVGLVTTAQLVASRRYAIVGIFVAAALLTPPDIGSQVALALPLLVLFETSIFVGRMIERARPAADAEPASE